MYTATIVEPTGVPASIEIKIPASVHVTDINAEHIVTDLKLLKMLMAERAGNTIRADIRRDPTRFIARTIIIAIITAIKILYAPAFVPVALEKFSSNEMLKILL